MKKNIVFMGTPDFSSFILEELIKHHNVVLAITQPDKPIGRKRTLTPPPVKITAIKHNIPIMQPKSLKNNKEIYDAILSFMPDYIIVAAYGKILPLNILKIAPCINTHASLLPKYRGASPIQSAILNQESESGVTLMNMDEGLDTGDILMQESLNIVNLNSIQVFNEMSKLSASMLIKFLSKPDEYKPLVQNNDFATVTKVIKKEDGLIELDDAESVYAKFLAYYEWPKIFLKNGIKLIDIEINDELSCNKEGEILDVLKDYFVLSCAKGSLKIKKIQESGKKVLDAKSFLNGKRMKKGDLIC